MEPDSCSQRWASPDTEAAHDIESCRAQSADTCTVMIDGGLAATGTVMAHRRVLTPAGMSMLLTVAQQHHDEDLSVQVRQATRLMCIRPVGHGLQCLLWTEQRL